MRSSSSYHKLDDNEPAKGNPRTQAGILSRITFWWVLDLLKLGNKRQLDNADLYPLLEEDTSEHLTEKLETAWLLELKRGRNASLMRAIFRIHSFKTYFESSILCGIWALSDALQPLLVILILAELIKLTETSLQDILPYLLVICISIITTVAAIVKQLLMYQARIIGTHIRTALTGFVYKKILRARQTVIREMSTGFIVNLIAGDFQRIDLVVFWISVLFKNIVDIAIGLVLLWYFAGLESLTGILFIFLASAYGALSGKASTFLRKKAAEVADKRIGLISAIVVGIRTIKMNAWEWPMMGKVQVLRRQEAKFIYLKGAIASTLKLLKSTSKSIAILISLLTMFVSGAELTRIKVAAVLVLYQSISNNVARFLKELPSQMADFCSAVTRTKYLITFSDCQFVRKAVQSNFEHDVAILFDNVSCKLSDSKSSPFELKNIKLVVKCGELRIVTGKIGSGKTTFLLSILGQLPLVCGKRCVRGRVVYVSQQPWVFSDSVRENILFGKEYEEQKYKAVLDACDLHIDIENFPNNDDTLIGERGVLLSGGQRLRVGLARALYADADIYLLDDPLSAVDVHVGKHIFEQCICQYLAGKTRILVTHQLQYLKNAERIVMLQNGEILTEGTYDQVHEQISDELMGDADAHSKSSRVHDSFGPNGAPRKTTGIWAHAQKMEASKGLVIANEERDTQTLSLGLYKQYISAGLSCVLAIGLLAFFGAGEGLVVLSDWVFVQVPKSLNSPQSHIIALFGGLVGGIFVVAFLRSFLVFLAAINASTNLHNRMLLALLKTHVYFYDTNPAGRILNRFSRDMTVLDDLLPKNILYGLDFAFIVLTGIVVPTVLNPWVFLVTVPLLLFSGLVARFYIRPAKDIARLGCINSSPIFSHVSDTLEGVVTIWAHGMTDPFLQRLHNLQDIHTQDSVVNIAAIQWMAMSVNIIGTVFNAVVMVIAILTKLNQGAAVLSFVYTLQGVIENSWLLVQFLTAIENSMSSVERAFHYSEISSEPGYETSTDPPLDWPQNGKIILRDVSLKYYPEGPTVLENINLHVEANKKIGVAGRTGAGKSSLVAALCRMPEPTGMIYIDGIDIKSLNIQSARRAMSVIPQDPILFDGSLRLNLDPFERFHDSQVWQALEDVGMRPVIENLPHHLDERVREYGSNFSAGERQLVCLARAMLQRSKIIILDEATANVDYRTDALIQETIRVKSKECTVITIAHRLQTIADCDKIVVLENGQILTDGNSSDVEFSRENVESVLD